MEYRQIQKTLIAGRVPLGGEGVFQYSQFTDKATVMQNKLPLCFFLLLSPIITQNFLGSFHFLQNWHE